MVTPLSYPISLFEDGFIRKFIWHSLCNPNMPYHVPFSILIIIMKYLYIKFAEFSEKFSIKFWMVVLFGILLLIVVGTGVYSVQWIWREKVRVTLGNYIWIRLHLMNRESGDGSQEPGARRYDWNEISIKTGKEMKFYHLSITLKAISSNI